MPPHVYAVVDQAYNDMIITRENQSILITYYSFYSLLTDYSLNIEVNLGLGKLKTQKKSSNILLLPLILLEK